MIRVDRFEYNNNIKGERQPLWEGNMTVRWAKKMVSKQNKNDQRGTRNMSEGDRKSYQDNKHNKSK